MSTSCKVLNPLHVEKWDELLLHYPGATFFHTQCWANVLSETYGYEPVYFSNLTNENLLSLVPMMEIRSILTGRRGVSLPFTDYLPSLVTNREEARELWKELVAFGKKSKWQYIDLHGDIGVQAKARIYDSFYQHDLRLGDGTEQILSRFSSNNRRNIKKAVREGVEIEIRQDIQSIVDFYHLNSMTRKRHGLPSQPYRFFENIYNYVISVGKGIVVIAKKNREVVAGSIYLLSGDSAIYKYGASKIEGRYLRANNLVMWEAIKWLSGRKYKNLSLGRTEKTNDGLVRYKDGWSAEKKSINYYRFSLKDNKYVTKKKSSDSLGTRFFRVAPVTVSSFLGEVFYKHVG